MTDASPAAATTDPGGGGAAEVDVVVVGAGFAGLYLLHRLRRLGISARAFDAASDVGGTWWWNRYPGARCDIPTTDYTYSFDPELEQAWTWSEKYATQPEILAYLSFVADRYDLRRDITFSTSVTAAAWDDATGRWDVGTSTGERVRCRHLVMATGCLSRPKVPDVPGADRFAGDVLFTSSWPHEGVDLTGKRVAVIGTGSSGIQSIPLIAEQAAELTVFQRTPNFSMPARNGPPPADRLAALAADRDAYREAGRRSRGGATGEVTDILGALAPEDVRRDRFEAAWATGQLFEILSVFADELVDPASNEIVAEMIREKIRAVVDDPDVAEALSPRDYPFGTKRPCLDTGYYTTFNQPHVHLVDLRDDPIATVTETGIDTTDRSFAFDVIVYATGFDAMTGALLAVDIQGRDDARLRDEWADGPRTYLGLSVVGFPNLWTITGPQSPSVLSNMAVSIEQHVDFVVDLVDHARREGFDVVEATPTAEAGWGQHAADCADITLYPRANSWYMGANVPGKPRVLTPYTGGVGPYRAACEDVEAAGYLGFRFTGPGGERCRDGVVRSTQPDVALVLEAMAAMGLPPLESLSPVEARAFSEAAGAQSPPGPEVGEVVDGMLPGAAGDLRYRLYRPATPGPHPVMVWFHGGGWVLGSHVSDDPLCRDLCNRTEMVVVSVDYRHAPEARFPAAADDAVAAVAWIAQHTIELGGVAGQLLVGGWSAGGNLAAVVCQAARDAGGPRIDGQVLLHPVTDADPTRPSYVDNAEGYVLTAPLMAWFWDHYAEVGDRSDPRASPLRGELAGLPPAVVVTADLDPLRDEGVAYAGALEAAGVPVTHLRARGHTHTSVTMVGVVISGAAVRAELAGAVRALLPSAQPAGVATA